jgi:dTDP-4-dehydrorhamnose 3,5-epimerase
MIISIFRSLLNQKLSNGCFLQVEKTEIRDLLIIQPQIFEDERGYFFEAHNRMRMEYFGLNLEFVQDNISCSRQGTIRGLHYQIGEFEQGKLVSVFKGKVLDVAVDIRIGSPTFGKHLAIELSDKNKTQLWIPPGFAHGFSVLSDNALFYYKCTNFYNREHERSIIYNDESLNIKWKVENPLVSKKDLAAKNFIEINDEDFFIYRK